MSEKDDDGLLGMAFLIIILFFVILVYLLFIVFIAPTAVIYDGIKMREQSSVSAKIISIFIIILTIVLGVLAIIIALTIRELTDIFNATGLNIAAGVIMAIALALNVTYNKLLFGQFSPVLNKRAQRLYHT